MEDRQTGRRVTTSSGRSTAVSAAWSHPRARLRGGPGWSVRPSSEPPALPLCQPPRPASIASRRRCRVSWPLAGCAPRAIPR